MERKIVEIPYALPGRAPESSTLPHDYSLFAPTERQKERPKQRQTDTYAMVEDRQRAFSTRSENQTLCEGGAA